MNSSDDIKKTSSKQKSIKYTCNEYREEMILVSLRQRLATEKLSSDEKDKLIEEIEKIEKSMGF
ncbi:MAG: hypothetical protein HQK67_02325 [Desulfamplus sp.]|nr:hypothetical protein [Desulfamplus sp.]